MAYFDTTWYVNFGNGTSTGYYAVPQWQANHAYSPGQLIRQLATPAVGSERVFICYQGNTSGSTEPGWVLTRGAKFTTDGSPAVAWIEVTGQAALNGDLANTPNWNAVKGSTVTQGQIIKRNNGASYQMAAIGNVIAGSGAEPAFSDTAGVTTNDSTGIWTSLGPVSNFTGGQAPFARLASVGGANWFAAGNTVYVGDNHAESQATAITITLTGPAPGRIICHNHAGSYPPTSSDLRTTATISTTAAVSITYNFIGYAYGLTAIAGVGQSGIVSIVLAIAAVSVFFEACTFKLASTAGNSVISLNTAGSSNAAAVVAWNNCQVSFAAAGQFIDIGYTNFTWQNTAPVLATGSTVPTNLIGQNISGTRTCNVMLEALDLSQVTAVFKTESANGSLGVWVPKDCKLNASATFPTPPNTGHTYQIIRADGGATGYKSARYAYEGTETTETSITRVGGAADPTGQAQSRKIVTTPNSQWLRPFKAEPYDIWNPTTAANVTVTVCGTINAGALPNNDDIWLECEYLGSASFPIGTIVNTTKANLLAANAAVASDSSTWNGGGSGAGWSPFKLVAVLSAPQPGMAGYLHVRVRGAKPGTTYYIDPKITLS